MFEFFRERAKDEIAIQIRELREKLEMRQIDFAKQADMKQSAVSRIEQADYSGWTFKTLLKVAEALDARLKITFQPMDDVIAEYENRERILENRAETGVAHADIAADNLHQFGIGEENAAAEPFARRVQAHPAPPKNPAYSHLKIEKPAGASFENLETPSQ
ncbi:MAG: helix-turn-helix transcriptional regulator [Nitrospinae bacterium]|nr:helix-turn-helix transcriptional regulator [Nitrospinota bacterium]